MGLLVDGVWQEHDRDIAGDRRHVRAHKELDSATG